MYTILVIDDERIIREGISKAITKEFNGVLSVFTSDSSKNALCLLKKFRTENKKIDILLTDIVMPEINGLELIKECKKENFGCKYLILSSYDDFKFTQSAIRNGVSDYILKPCSPTELKHVILPLVNELKKNETNTIEEKQDVMIQTQETKNLHTGQNSNTKPLAAINTNIQKQLLLDYFYSTNTILNNENSLQLGLSDKEYRFYLLPAIVSQSGDIFNSIRTKLLEILPDPFIFFKTNTVIIFCQCDKQETASSTGIILRETVLSLFPLWNFPVMISPKLSFETIPLEFKKIQNYLPISSFFVEKKILFTDNIKLNHFEKNRLIEDLCKEIKSSAKNTDTKHAELYLEQIFAESAKCFYDFQSLKNIAIHIYYLLISSVHQNYKNNENTKLEMMTLIGNTESSIELQKILKQFIYDTISQFQSFDYQKLSPNVQKTVDYISFHINDCDLSLSKITEKAVFINSDYLGKIFKKETGVKFCAYVLKMRMDTAKELLKNSNMSILEISEKTGFQNTPSYFSRLFRHETGFTPSEYRNSEYHI